MSSELSVSITLEDFETIRVRNILRASSCKSRAVRRGMQRLSDEMRQARDDIKSMGDRISHLEFLHGIDEDAMESILP